MTKVRSPIRRSQWWTAPPAAVPVFDDVDAFATCVQCHSSNFAGVIRQGAPVGIDFNTYEAAVANAEAATRSVFAETMPPLSFTAHRQPEGRPLPLGLVRNAAITNRPEEMQTYSSSPRSGREAVTARSSRTARLIGRTSARRAISGRSMSGKIWLASLSMYCSPSKPCT